VTSFKRNRTAPAQDAAPAGAIAGAPASESSPTHKLHLLHATRTQLRRAALKLAGYLAGAYLVLKLIPGLEAALGTLGRVRWPWVVAALAVETFSETGFAMSWGAIVDPEHALSGDDRGARMDRHFAWAQLGGGTLVPGGSLGGVGVGAWMLHRFGMPGEVVAERQFNLSFLNTAVDALALIFFGLGLASGILPGSQNLALTLLPAVLAAAGVLAALLIARRAGKGAWHIKHRKIAAALTTLSAAVEDTRRVLFHRSGGRAVLGALAYLGFDVLVLWGAFIAIGGHPMPGFAVVLMAYIIGALGGSIPLPASLGTIGGMVGMLILYGVRHDAALVAVLLYQAVGMIVPVVGGGIAYLFVRHSLRSSPPRAEEQLAKGGTQ